MDCGAAQLPVPSPGCVANDKPEEFAGVVAVEAEVPVRVKAIVFELANFVASEAESPPDPEYPYIQGGPCHDGLVRVDVTGNVALTHLSSLSVAV